jgi:AraC-like DNA-binding protein
LNDYRGGTLDHDRVRHPGGFGVHRHRNVTIHDGDVSATHRKLAGSVERHRSYNPAMTPQPRIAAVSFDHPHATTGMIRLVPEKQDHAWGLYVTAVGQGQQPCGAPMDGWRLYYLVRGAAILRTPGHADGAVEAGDVILLDATRSAEIICDQERGCLAHQIDFSGKQLTHLTTEGFFSPMPRILHLGFNEQLLGLVAQVFELARLRPPGFGRLLSGVLANLVARLDADQQVKDSGSAHGQLVETARELLIDTSHDRIPVHTLALKMGISYSRFRRSFRGETGVSPHQFRLSQRLARAQQMLADTALPIARIANELGFSSQAYFARIFRRQTGFSPSIWRINLAMANRQGSRAGL